MPKASAEIHAKVAAMDAGDLARLVFAKAGAAAWEPPEPNHPTIIKLIDAGYLRRCDMRCGFERFRDTGVKWTEAGLAVVRPQIDWKQRAEAAIDAAEKHLSKASMRSSAELALDDAKLWHARECFDTAVARARDSLAYSVGVFHEDYRNA